ncbi:aldose 1-epimerase [Sphingomonas oryzagri]|uniref:Aldose 1-epimerase n=1 Tax=Sphingomonas oryzagri TaxID=3042314 RepID=A0ABT6MXZ6_9SPHN|nr:aldose 1-epimerase [Sphingomonas oryzagri]MDH7637369.1 aldose 1-epimerase [Sphingomonas oryzagri]
MRIAAGSWELALAPELGGGITALRRDGQDVLRAAPEGANEPLQLSSFAMVPYANRIANGRFEADGAHYSIAVNYAGQDHPLHGVSWLRPWNVAASDATSATLAHVHSADEAWPWSYRAEQHFALDEAGLSIALTLTNTDGRAMPASMGFHPYFPATTDTTLRFDADGMWERDERFLPSTLAGADVFGDWSSGQSVQTPTLIDNSYVGWAGSARISRSDGDVLLTGEGTPVLHLYTPPGEPFFCAEPATSMPDAFNRSTPVMLQPGEQHRIGMAIRSA